MIYIIHRPTLDVEPSGDHQHIWLSIRDSEEPGTVSTGGADAKLSAADVRELIRQLKKVARECEE